MYRPCNYTSLLTMCVLSATPCTEPATLCTQPATLCVQVVLDEFSSALDADTEAALLPTLRKALVGRTLILITHRQSTLQLVDRVVELGEGGTIISDTSNADRL